MCSFVWCVVMLWGSQICNHLIVLCGWCYGQALVSLNVYMYWLRCQRPSNLVNLMSCLIAHGALEICFTHTHSHTHTHTHTQCTWEVLSDSVPPRKAWWERHRDGEVIWGLIKENMHLVLEAVLHDAEPGYGGAWETESGVCVLIIPTYPHNTHT